MYTYICLLKQFYTIYVSLSFPLYIYVHWEVYIFEKYDTGKLGLLLPIPSRKDGKLDGEAYTAPAVSSKQEFFPARSDDTITRPQH